ncbi:MAG TPA: cell division protein ZipA C-terminal FtsZ-binding domain-containing protein [Gallionella sp.]|jgi:FtsZ-interacting cell division protein ZipA|nr:cell division protein ZipA C-terminal FtsZ-binding domain-containing protein [Gallionella sp.]
MSELQTTLLAIGLGVIVAVYIFGWWQQRKYRSRFGAAFKANHADALYQENTAAAPEQIQQPALAEVNEVTVEIANETNTAAEIPVEVPATERSDRSSPGDFCALLDARSDFIIELHPAEPCPAAALDGLWQRKFDFDKPVQVCGMILNSQQWERAIAEGQTLYSHFRIALQLVDRGGAISAAKLADFRDLVLGVAKHIKADAAAPDVHETHRRAVELDTFCAEVDQMIGISLVPPGERLLLCGKISQAAALRGMTLEADGAFHLPDARGHSLFSLASQDAQPFQHHTPETQGTAGITLLLDVPRTENPGKQFFRMARIARELARELQANLVDDQRVALTDPALAVIREQIIRVETKMSANNIVPGSAQARRLFD